MTGTLVEAGPLTPDFNTFEASVFDISGASSLDVAFLNGAQGSGVFVSIFLPPAPVTALAPAGVALVIGLMGLAGYRKLRVR